MPFYRDANRLENKSTITQARKDKNCYVMAAIAAGDIAGKEPDMASVIKAVGDGMGGNSDRAFKAMGLYPVTKDVRYRDIWSRLIELAVDEGAPACLSIKWKDMDENSKGERASGNHVIYVTGHESGRVYARDQQNNQVLISVRMTGMWTSEEFVAGKKTSRVCNVSSVGVGFLNKERARIALETCSGGTAVAVPTASAFASPSASAAFTTASAASARKPSSK